MGWAMISKYGELQQQGYTVRQHKGLPNMNNQDVQLYKQGAPIKLACGRSWVSSPRRGREGPAHGKILKISRKLLRERVLRGGKNEAFFGRE